MRGLVKSGLAALLLGAAAVAGTAARASVDADADADADRNQPNNSAQSCRHYLEHDLPAPRRCYRYFYNAIGPDVFVRGGLVFEDRDAYDQYRESGGAREHWADRDVRGAREDRYRETDEDDRMSERAESSGGASRGEHVSHASGGASRGERVPQGPSGGASSH
ncbi:MAG: hypothetical protein ACJ8IR_11035 [Alphaproteobacteria bacterium]|jgi:hypothetical protein